MTPIDRKTIFTVIDFQGKHWVPLKEAEALDNDLRVALNDITNLSDEAEGLRAQIKEAQSDEGTAAGLQSNINRAKEILARGDAEQRKRPLIALAEEAADAISRNCLEFEAGTNVASVDMEQLQATIEAKAERIRGLEEKVEKLKKLRWQQLKGSTAGVVIEANKNGAWDYLVSRRSLDGGEHDPEEIAWTTKKELLAKVCEMLKLEQPHHVEEMRETIASLTQELRDVRAEAEERGQYILDLERQVEKLSHRPTLEAHRSLKEDFRGYRERNPPWAISTLREAGEILKLRFSDVNATVACSILSDIRHLMKPKTGKRGAFTINISDETILAIEVLRKDFEAKVRDLEGGE